MARFSKLHPCFGFLHCQPDHYRQIYNQLCKMRDDDIKAGNLSGGMPTGFKSWAFEDLKTKATELTQCLIPVVSLGPSLKTCPK